PGHQAVLERRGDGSVGASRSSSSGNGGICVVPATTRRRSTEYRAYRQSCRKGLVIVVINISNTIHNIDLTKQKLDTTLADRTYKIIEELIVTLKLAPGAPISELSLSKQLNIGRTPVREALQRLSREGLVVILPRRGILVSEISVKTQLQVLEV